MAAATESENAVHSHTHCTPEAGATVEEIEPTVMLAVTTRGFPAMITAPTWAQAAISGHES